MIIKTTILLLLVQYSMCGGHESTTNVSSQNATNKVNITTDNVYQTIRQANESTDVVSQPTTDRVYQPTYEVNETMGEIYETTTDVIYETTDEVNEMTSNMNETTEIINGEQNTTLTEINETTSSQPALQTTLASLNSVFPSSTVSNLTTRSS
ncbi:unnamed protein product [Schistosoma rodhaini]|uniref:Uncharacterized protein n=1 Tax=Schistosoma rodhaini TaxID=6188 RepID=A0AA85ER99_9TREM|nr:unnamed protein product [Schistosoma rodhaini]